MSNPVSTLVNTIFGGAPATPPSPLGNLNNLNNFGSAVGTSTLTLPMLAPGQTYTISPVNPGLYGQQTGQLGQQMKAAQIYQQQGLAAQQYPYPQYPKTQYPNAQVPTGDDAVRCPVHGVIHTWVTLWSDDGKDYQAHCSECLKALLRLMAVEPLFQTKDGIIQPPKPQDETDKLLDALEKRDLALVDG